MSPEEREALQGAAAAVELAGAAVRAAQGAPDDALTGLLAEVSERMRAEPMRLEGALDAILGAVNDLIVAEDMEAIGSRSGQSRGALVTLAVLVLTTVAERDRQGGKP